MKKKVFLTGYYGFGNTGDEAILEAMLAHLRTRQPDLEITVTSATPEQTAARYNVQSILWSDALAMLEAARAADLVLIGGGGIFHDYWGFNPNALLTDQHWGISFYAGPAVLGALYRKPVMLYAVGVGPLLSEHGKRFTKVAAEAACTISVRDAQSKDILTGMGIPANKITVTADPVFGLPVRLPSQVPERKGPRIAVSVRTWSIGIHPSFWEPELAAGLDRFLDLAPDASIVIVPFQFFEGDEDDRAVSERIVGRMRNKERIEISGELTPAAITGLFAACDLVVGMRLHSMILSFLAGTPALALSYDPKVDQVMDRTGLSPYSIPITALDAETLAARIQSALQEQAAIRGTISSIRESLAAGAQHNADLAIATLETGQPEVLPLDPDVVAMLIRTLETQLRDTKALRIETKRLLGEVEFYIEQSSKRAAELQTTREQAEGAAQKLKDYTQLSEDVVTLRQEIAVERKNSAGLQESLLVQREQAAALRHELSTKLDRFEQTVKDLHALHQEQLQQREQLHDAQQSAAQAAGEAARWRAAAESAIQALSKAEQMRDRTIRSVDRYQHTLNELAAGYRNQRAWQVMLLIRKAYTILFRRGTGAFLKWVFGIPFSGFGSLAEYDLTYPNLWNFIPERLEVPFPIPTLPDSSGSAISPALSPASGPQAVPPAARKLADLVPQQKYDVVIMAIFDFDFRFQRPQQIAAGFARNGHRVFWVSPARFLEPSSKRPYEAIPLRENMWEIHLRGKAQNLYTGELSASDAAGLHNCLSEMYRDFGIAESSVILQFPYWRQVGLNLRKEFGTRLVYDCMDDWQNWTAEPRISAFNLNEEKQLVKDADVLVVTSQEFLERHRANGIDPVLARNGADFDFFSSPRPNTLLSEKTKPIVGYYGAIADWFDLELVTKLAKSRPQYSFVIIGGVHDVDVSALKSLPNVTMPGEKNYREIPMFLSQFDVCLIPFRLNKLTKGVDPVKMYEYFSQGKPVVATDMAELAQSTSLLYIGKNHDDYIRKVDQAIQENDPGVRSQRIEFAKQNTWNARVDAIDAAIGRSFPKASILMVTYNSEEYLEPCIDSVLRNTAWPSLEVLIVDNKSTDRTREILKRYAAQDARVRLDLLDFNSGFAGGNNLAAKEARGEYVVFLNPDTIVTPGWLERMVRHCWRDEKVGAVAAVTNFSGNESKINTSYTNVVEMLEFAQEVAKQHDGESQDITVAALYCVLVPRRVWTEIGGLDESYQVGMFEDDDFSLRIQRAGYRVITAEDAFIHHFGNGSFAKIPSGESLRIFEKNKKRFEEKWGVSWQQHKLRPGTRSPFDEQRFTPDEFLRVPIVRSEQNSSAAVLVQLHPSMCFSHSGFNVQPDGQSALVVKCERANPATVIVFNGVMLNTSYGGPSLLTALVPPGLYAKAGSYPVHLLNDFGESNRMQFVVEAKRNSAAAD